MVAWGVNFAITKVVLAELGVWPFLFIRFLAMPLAGFALLLAITRRHFPRTWPRRGDLARFVAGAVGLAAAVLGLGRLFAAADRVFLARAG